MWTCGDDRLSYLPSAFQAKLSVSSCYRAILARIYSYNVNLYPTIYWVTIMNRTASGFKHFANSKHLLSFGCVAVLGFNWNQVKLHAESKSSDSQKPWPKTRPLIADSANSRRNPQSQQTNAQKASAERPSTDEGDVDSREDDAPLFEDEESAAWASFSTRFSEARNSLMAVGWSSIRDKIANHVLPEWSLVLPEYVAKLQTELDMGPQSLSHEIWNEALDPDLNPDIISKANVRISKDLCPDEVAFVRRRKHHTTKALSKYLNIPEDEIDPRDIPTIAVVSLSWFTTNVAVFELPRLFSFKVSFPK